MKSHTEIIAGIGIRALARALGHPNPSTVQGWAERNKIPQEHWTSIVQAAEREGWSLTAIDFLPTELRDAAA